MKRIFALTFILMTAMLFAGVEAPFVQFAPSDYCGVHQLRGDQNWWGAQLITLNVKADTNVWLSNYVSNFYTSTPDLHGYQFDMVGDQKYGYIFKDSLPNLNATNYEDLINWSNGTTTDITYYSNENPDLKTTTKGYLLDHFVDDAEIYLVMTTLAGDGGETVDSYQYVQDADHDTSLISRQHNTVDVAGNVRVNFGIDSVTYGEIGREFVAVYDTGDIDDHHMSGQPLPGTMTSCLLAIGFFGAMKLRKKKRLA